MSIDEKMYTPPRAQGMLFNLGMSLVLGLVSLALLFLATDTTLGAGFLLYLLAALVVALPVPVLVYRAFSLWRSSYKIERNGLRVKWGFREAAIPINAIEYVELAEDLLFPLELPGVRWPGAVVGAKQQEKLGQVEFLASQSKNLVMIGTASRVFVISPGNARDFVRTYREMTELGSLDPFEPYSHQPQFFLADIWQIPETRTLLTITLLLSMALFGLVGWAIPNLSDISLGYDSLKEPLPPVSPGQLFLLPILNILMVTASYVLSLFFFREHKKHKMVTVLWVGNVITALLFLTAVLFIL